VLEAGFILGRAVRVKNENGLALRINKNGDG